MGILGEDGIGKAACLHIHLSYSSSLRSRRYISCLDLQWSGRKSESKIEMLGHAGSSLQPLGSLARYYYYYSAPVDDSDSSSLCTLHNPSSQSHEIP